MESTHTAPALQLQEQERPAIPAACLRWFLLSHIFIASIASLMLVTENARHEPYTTFVPREAVAQLGGGMVLLAVWAYIGAGIVAGVLTKRLSRGWLAALGWIWIVLPYLKVCPTGYINDLARHLNG